MAQLPPIASKLTAYTQENIQFSDDFDFYPVTQSWDFGDGQVSNEQNPEHSYANVGTYVVNLTVTNEYKTVATEKAAVITVIANPNTALEEDMSDNGNKNILVYPVPSNSILYIQLLNTEDCPATVYILGLDGKTLRTFEMTTNKTQINISGIEPGVYIAKIKTGKNTYYEKIRKL
jgi:PKD repeat protein